MGYTQKNISGILLFIIFLVILLCFFSYLIREIPDFISIDKYPELIILLNNKQIFSSEINEYSKTYNWTKFDSSQIVNKYSIFHNMKMSDLKKFLNEFSGSLNIGSPSCKIFWIKLNNIIIDGNAFYCPKSIRYLFKINNTINIGVIALEPGFNGSFNIDYSNIIRVYVPFFIPEGDNGIYIGGKSLQWNYIDNNEGLIIFDSSLSHNIWNYSGTNVYILLIDIINK